MQNRKYLYLIPQGGFNDILCRIMSALIFCRRYNRILLLDTVHTISYGINWSDFFGMNISDVIYDIKKIKNIILNSNKKLSVYPKELDGKILDIIDGKFRLERISKPTSAKTEDVIFNRECGGCFSGYSIFKLLKINLNIKRYCQIKYSSIPKKYLGIHIRNTDYKNNYRLLYKKNKSLIHKYDNIYVASDDPRVIEYFKTKNLNVFNFTTFHESPNETLHYSNVPGNIKIRDIMCDIFILSQSDKILSTSKGGFTQLIKSCFKKKKEVWKQFL